MVSISISALRSGLTLADNTESDQTTHPYLLNDTELDQTLRIDEHGRNLVQFLSQERSVAEIFEHCKNSAKKPISPVTLFNYVTYFYRHHLYDGLRFERYKTLVDLAARPASDEIKLLFNDQARHLCQASGSCCGHTDIGPIPKSRMNKILARDWVGTVPHIKSNSELFSTVNLQRDQREVTLINKRHNNYCTFLDSEGLCIVHREIGFEQKPLICRQFPFVFTDTPEGTVVSIMMECREYARAKKAAKPLDQDRQAELMALVEGGAVRHKMPKVVPLDDHLTISYSDYSALEKQIFERLGDRSQSLQQVLVAIRDLVLKERDLAQAEIGAKPGFVQHKEWQTIIPNLVYFDDTESSFRRAVQRFYTRVGQAIQKEYRAYQEVENFYNGNRMVNLQKALSGVFFDFDFEFFRMTDPAIEEVLRDILLNEVLSKAVIRDRPLINGLAHAFLRVLLTLSQAIVLASYGCRSHLTERDVIDAMVTVSKVIRDREIRETLELVHHSVKLLFFDRLELFVYGCRWEERLRNG